MIARIGCRLRAELESEDEEEAAPLPRIGTTSSFFSGCGSFAGASEGIGNEIAYGSGSIEALGMMLIATSFGLLATAARSVTTAGSVSSSCPSLFGSVIAKHQNEHNMSRSMVKRESSRKVLDARTSRKREQKLVCEQTQENSNSAATCAFSLLHALCYHNR